MKPCAMQHNPEIVNRDFESFADLVARQTIHFAESEGPGGAFRQWIETLLENR
jgi:hypothetical protein